MPPLLQEAKDTLGALVTRARRRLPAHLQAAYFGRPRGYVSLANHSRTANCSVEWVRRGGVSCGAPPTTVEEALHWKFETPYYRERHHTPIWVARLNNAFVRGGRYVLTPDYYLIEDVTNAHAVHPGLPRGLATRRPFMTRETHHAVVPLGTHWCTNHFHWFMDVLPRVGILSECGILPDPALRYAIPASVSATHREALRYLGIPEEQLLRMGPSERLQVEHLILPSLPERRGNPPAWACRFLRERLLPFASHIPRGPQRIYVERLGKRRVLNQSAVDAVLSAHGLTKVHPEDYTLMQQIALFRDADLIVGPHGAGMATTVFASPGAQVVEIFSPNYVNVCNAAIASRLNLQYAYVLGKGKRPPAGVDPFRVFDDITADVRELDQLLSACN